jgi:hypothetical protein
MFQNVRGAAPSRLGDANVAELRANSVLLNDSEG